MKSSLHRNILLILAVCVATAFFVGYEASGPFLSSSVQGGGDECPSPEPVSCPQEFVDASLPAKEKYFAVRLKLPAIDKNDKGALADLLVEARSGNGAVFIRVDRVSPLINPDTQSSVRTALAVAKKVSGKSLHGVNVYYTISSPSDLVGGKSAGAALAVASIALMMEEQLDENAVITGIIDEEGRISAVGKIYEKALAVKEAGYKKFLVPEGEGRQSIPKESCMEEVIDGVTRRECRTVLKVVDVGKEVGLEVVEVYDVQEAFALMRK